MISMNAMSINLFVFLLLSKPDLYINFTILFDLFYFYRQQTKFAKVMFLHVSVILSTGGGLPQCMLGYPPGAITPSPGAAHQEQAPLRSRHPPEQTPPRPGTHPSPGSRACWEIRPTSGRYASYWNAFLSLKIFDRSTALLNFE